MERRGVLKKMVVDVGPNMTPMVDVVMCILIFFMLRARWHAGAVFEEQHGGIEKGGWGRGGDNQIAGSQDEYQASRAEGGTRWCGVLIIRR